jgi:hypothetical protein
LLAAREPWTNLREAATRTSKVRTSFQETSSVSQAVDSNTRALDIEADEGIAKIGLASVSVLEEESRARLA